MVEVNIPIEQLTEAPLRCAWKGCHETCAGYPAPLPVGWRCMVTFRETRDPRHLDFVYDRMFRDAVLCVEHADALEALLTPLPGVNHEA